MPRIKTELLQEGMIVGSDVKNIDNMLLIPNGCKLTARQIGILQAWGVLEIEVATEGNGHDTDPMAGLSPELVEAMTQELRSQFWKADDEDPVFAALFKIILRRNARRKGEKVNV